MAAIGDSSQLLMLAFDHRGAYSNGVFDATDPAAAKLISRSKELIYEGFLEMKGKSESGKIEGLGVLADEEFAIEVVKRAPKEGAVLGMPAENGYAPHFTLEAPDIAAAVERIKAAGPRFVKVLVKVDDGTAADVPWLQSLREFSVALNNVDWSLVPNFNGTKRSGALLVEPIIPGVAIDDAIDFEKRSLAAIDLIASAGVCVDIWKLQPQGSKEAMERVALRCKELNPAVGLILLGQGMAMDQLKNVVQWASELQPLYCGFAIGRTAWAEAVKKWAGDEDSDFEERDQALRLTVAQRFQEFVEVWQTTTHRDHSLL